MEETRLKHSPFVVLALAFIVAIGVGIGYYQFSYLPYINLKPSIPEEILNPLSFKEVSIIEGSFNQDQQENFVPKRVVVQLGIDNKVVWINNDVAPHTVTSDNDYIDPASGVFNSVEHEGTRPVIQPGQRFEFVFTQVGEYPYHCQPHPWMTGIVVVEKAKF